jgi:hypothetical protein
LIFGGTDALVNGVKSITDTKLIKNREIFVVNMLNGLTQELRKPILKLSKSINNHSSEPFPDMNVKTSRDIFNMNCPKNEAGNSRNSERNTLEGNADCLLDGRTNAIGCSTFVSSRR